MGGQAFPARACLYPTVTGIGLRSAITMFSRHLFLLSSVAVVPRCANRQLT